MSVDEDTLETISDTLAAEADFQKSSVDFGEGLDIVLRSLPDVVLVGIDKDPGRAVEFAKLVRKENARVTLIAVGGTRDADRILAATRAGFADYIVLPDDTEQLRVSVQTAAFHAEEAEGKGLVVAVVGAKGGVGCTFVSTHLAAELAAIHRVLCIDADFTMGDIAPAMDIVPKDTMADLLPRASQVDERMLTGTVFVHPSKVHFLCQPDDIDRVGAVSGDDMYNIINAAAHGYQYVIIDIGDQLDEATTVALSVADQILLLTTPDVVSVRDSHRMVKAMTAIGIERKRINVVLNRVPKQPFLTREAIENNLGLRIVGSISDDPRRVDHAINDGKLLREVYPKAEIVSELARLVGLLSDDPEDLNPSPDPDQKKSLFGRFFGR
ncbi:MAG: AAA family ATPase [Alphaproteobacteria bacterium]|nr:AAA family ATPase [Alphaproteobacteria bacterium]